MIYLITHLLYTLLLLQMLQYEIQKDGSIFFGDFLVVTGNACAVRASGLLLINPKMFVAKKGQELWYFKWGILEVSKFKLFYLGCNFKHMHSALSSWRILVGWTKHFNSVSSVALCLDQASHSESMKKCSDPVLQWHILFVVSKNIIRIDRNLGDNKLTTFFGFTPDAHPWILLENFFPLAQILLYYHFTHFSFNLPSNPTLWN